MDVWFCIEQEQSPRGKNRERKNLKKLFAPPSKARQECSFQDIPHFFSKYPISDRNVGTYRLEEVGMGRIFQIGPRAAQIPLLLRNIPSDFCDFWPVFAKIALT